ncbi:MAG TPA: DMT family transporter [Candidatus Polarisedimenticolaceae bacterium]|nr:DMT family transporter [Candidatus Polarisedimenticolaceae bacterium]
MRPAERLAATRSLLLTGIADVWSTLRDGERQGSPASGLVLMVVSAAAFAAMAAFAKKLLPHTPTQAVVLSRGLLMTLVFVLLARRRGIPLLGRRPGVLLLRGLLGYGALSCYFWSVQHLPLGDAVLLQYSHPIFVALLAPLVLREHTGPVQLTLVAVALGGVALIVHPTGALRSAALVGVLGSMLSGVAYLTIRQLARTEHPLTIVVWFPLASLVPALIATLRAGPSALPRDVSEVAGHLLVTASALLGQIALTFGLSRAGAARATAVTLTGPVFGMLFGYALFGTVPTATSLLGTAVVLGALAALAWMQAKGPIPASATVAERVGDDLRSSSGGTEP